MTAKISTKQNSRGLSVIDLFCGVGGMTLGAARSGFKVIASVDNDPRTQLAFNKNFPNHKFLLTDISQLDGRNLLKEAQYEGHSIDGVIGGPPCQGFSRIGRRRPRDARNSLFCHFFRLVAELRPIFYVAENVLGICDAQFNTIRQNAFAKLQGYVNFEPLKLKASDYGAATSRERVFFIGILKERANNFSANIFQAPLDVKKINVAAALQGLRRKINPEWQTEKQGWRVITPQKSGLFWKKVSDDIPDGVGDTNAIRLLNDEHRVSGCLGTNHTKAVVRRFDRLAEGRVDGPSRAVRLSRKGYCPTLRSGTGPEHGSFQALRPIHPTEARVITPREAARLQGFPDWFQFDSTKWHSFKQIGNSVSPILAEYVLGVIATRLIREDKHNGN